MSLLTYGVGGDGDERTLCRENSFADCRSRRPSVPPRRIGSFYFCLGTCLEKACLRWLLIDFFAPPVSKRGVLKGRRSSTKKLA